MVEHIDETFGDEPVELFFGEGQVSVGMARIGADVVLTLGILPAGFEIGQEVPLGTEQERVRLHFSNTRSIDVVMGALRALRRRLARQCSACGNVMDAPARHCVQCNTIQSSRLAEHGSLACTLRSLVLDDEALTVWRCAWERSLETVTGTLDEADAQRAQGEPS